MSAPHITIQSITGVDIELRIAGAGSRSYAFVIDWHIRLLLALAWWVAGTVLAGGFAQLVRAGDKMASSYALLVVLPAVAIYFLYHPVLELAMRGRTPGKRIAGVRIVTRRGDLPSAGALLLRNLFRLLDSLPTFYLVGLVTVMLTEHNVRIGDLAAGTLLVIDNSTSEKSFARMSSTSDSHLPVQSIDLIHELLERWPQLDEATRADIARSLLAKVQPDSSAEALAGLSSNELQSRLRSLLS